ncbi:DUF1446 domain-containing protein [Salibacterium salarium]|uniref:DUF1446 domain-containing protein n=1 Tax=Salibacterium salarium TaxID=284579 RepID=A0A3R9PAB3_9BACI|nr:acyclic terpene utilization AtuA family protein [Salibacterium salarium]RSL33913.1 DUF1446 domain-containing protein [Salibacterium salarium]
MLKIGSGAGFSGDRLEPAEVLLKQTDLDYLVLECLAERTIALAQKEKYHHADKGYDPLLETRIRSILPLLHGKKTRVVTNMGAANPVAGADKIIELANELNIPCKVAAVTGDDVFTYIETNGLSQEEGEQKIETDSIISANAYLGAEALLPALKTGADIIITGRVADPSLFLAPQIHHFQWSLKDFEKLGKGTLVGHLLECGGQVSGGYFADPGKKEVAQLENLGFPYAEIEEEEVVIKKVEGTGGAINLQTVKEQLLYEVHDPSSYFTPDVIADFSNVTVKEIGENQVAVYGGNGQQRPEMLKVSIGYHAGFVGEGEISYAGTNAKERAELAGSILYERLSGIISHLRLDYIGVSSLHRTSFWESTPYEVRVRAAGQCELKNTAEIIGREVEALYTNGPAGGGGARKRMTESIGVVSSYIPRDHVKPTIVIRST